MLDIRESARAGEKSTKRIKSKQYEPWSFNLRLESMGSFPYIVEYHKVIHPFWCDVWKKSPVVAK